MNKAMNAIGVALFALTGVAVVAAPAAATTAPACDTTRKSVTRLIDRPDGGNNGPWALDTITRTVTFTKVEAVTAQTVTEHPRWSYHAEVVDEGTFITQAGKSPNKGVAVTPNANGVLKGSFTADFTAEACFKNFQNAFGGDTRHGQAPVTTPEWVRADWGGNDFQGSSINNDWHWLYTTPCEKWLDAANNSDGKADGAGDIVGKACPPASPSPSPSASHAGTSPSPTRSTGTVPVSDSLPVTGTNAGVIAAVGAILMAIGFMGIVFARHRRN